MARKTKGHSRSIGLGLDKMKHELRMQVIEVGMEAIGMLAEKVAEEANLNSKSIVDDWPTLPGQEKRRGPNKHGGSDSGPISGSVFAQPSDKVPSSYLVISPAWYSHFVEYGTSAPEKNGGKILPKKSDKLSFVGTNSFAGKAISTKSVDRSKGSKATPFLRPAADKADQFLNEIINNLKSM
jgi:hypothetical protein